MVEIRSPWRDMDEAAEYLRFKDASGQISAKACREFLHRKGVPMKRRGRTLLVHRDTLEAQLQSIRGPGPETGS